MVHENNTRIKHSALIIFLLIMKKYFLCIIRFVVLKNNMCCIIFFKKSIHLQRNLNKYVGKVLEKLLRGNLIFNYTNECVKLSCITNT